MNSLDTNVLARFFIDDPDDVLLSDIRSIAQEAINSQLPDAAA